jgi:hypothetical protein
MALVVKDRVRVSSITAGTGTITLGVAITGFQDFSVIGNGNTTFYTIVDPTTGDWEVGIGTYSSTGPTLARTTILESSTGGTAVSFLSNPKDVFVTYPAERSVYTDGTAISPATASRLGFTNLTQGSALSVLGVTGNATADVASIAAATDHQVMRRSGTAVAFGAVALNQANAVTGTLPIARGGTGLTTTPVNGALDIGNGTGFTRTTLTAGTGVTITNGVGSISIAANNNGTVTSVASGDGMDFTTITGSGTVTMGTPSTLTTSTTNATTATSHTHAITTASANTASTIVARDASGNFSAGTISLSAATGIDANGDASALTVRGGNSSSTSGSGGSLLLNGGDTVSTTSTKNGGRVDIRGGNNTSVSGGSGALLELYGGVAVLGVGGEARLYAGNSKGTNINGSNLMLFAGKGTGTGVGGTIEFYTSPTSGSGSLVQTSTSRLAINNLGRISALANIASSNTTTGTLVVTGGVGVSGTVYAGGFNGSLTGNATTATTATTATALATARTINGTSFDGSANITTANWGTARTLWGQSVNGSGNITAPLLPAAGTAALPAFATSGDTNTGIFFPAADTLAFAEGGTEVIRINSSSNVGVGTTSPGEKLDVNGSVRGLQLIASNGIVVNSATVSSNYTIPTGSNAMSAGAVTIADGITVTVSDGSNWVVI